ncbi:MAG: hypothetical protein QME78_13205 [Thermodesulfobacteriota bacterium]|nr:hypothetical protein [Thermodesulfobacteriota bacterium]
MSEPCLEEKLIYIFKKAGDGIFPDEPKNEDTITYGQLGKYLSKVFELLIKAFREG